MNVFLNIYRHILCRKFFYKFNYHLYRISLRGIGVLNSEGNKVTGEEYFLKYLSNNYSLEVIFDVGANTGEYTSEVSNYLPLVQLYSFEPHPETFKKLKKNIKQKNVLLFNLALGKNNKTMKLWDFADDAELKDTQPTSTLASLKKDVISDLHKQKMQGYPVKVTTVDEIVKQEKIEKISLLKIDTEGTEYDVLLGAKEVIKKGKIDIIQFEFNEMNVYSRTFMKDYVDLLPNYEFFRLMPHGLYPLGEYRPSIWEIFAFQNIAAIRKDIVSSIIQL